MKVLEVTEVDIIQEAKALSKVPNKNKFAVSKDYTIAILLYAYGGLFLGPHVFCVYVGKVKGASSDKSFFRYSSALNYFNDLVKKYKLEERVI